MRQTATGRHASRAFGTTGLKYTLAGVFMVGALGVLGWRIFAAGPGDDAPRRVRGEAITPEGEAVETNYTRVRSQDDAREAVARLGEEVGRRARSMDSVKGLAADAPAVVGAAATDAIGSFLTGSYAEFVEAMRRLGAQIDPDAESSPLFDRFSGWFAMGEPDLDRLEVRPFEPMSRAGDAGPGPGPRVVSRAAAVEEDEDREPGVGVRQMMMTAESLFPDASIRGEQARRPIEVRVPIRPKGGADKGGEVTLGVVLVWNESLGLWQPGAYSKTTYSREEDD